jgi:hypothetical protein
MSDAERIEGAIGALFNREIAARLSPRAPELLKLAKSGANYGRTALEQRIAVMITAFGLHLDEPLACGKLADAILTVAGPRAVKRPTDTAANAVHVMRVLTGEAEDEAPADDGKDPAAKALGAKGGAARAKSMTPERRREIAQAAAQKRWNKDG